MDDSSALAVAAPLVLDMDGTVLSTDAFLETCVAAARRHPLSALRAVGLLVRGRAPLKQRMAQIAQLDASLLPMNPGLVDYAAGQNGKGRDVHLATAADMSLARAVASRLGFISEVFASDGDVNLKSRTKAEVLTRRFPDGFVYAGDAPADRAVWKAAAGAVFAGRSRNLEAQAARLAPLEASFRTPGAGLSTWAKALRVHQWTKNVLLFAPLILSGRADRPTAWLGVMIGFLALSLAASAGYLINDLIDLPDDRAHWSKRHRPLASGALPIASALLALPLLLAVSLALGGLSAGWLGCGGVAVYLAATLAYSFRLKRVPILDVMVLALLFTFRLGYGAVVATAPIKPWLFIFAMFLFFSLSLAKRDVEIIRSPARGSDRVGGRGYTAADRPVVTALGCASAIASVHVLVLYLLEEAFGQGFYHWPQLLWAIPVLLGLWLGRIWLLCGRGDLDDDPVAFAIRDSVSLVLAIGVGLVFLAARLL